jgi:hypothetical protein
MTDKSEFRLEGRQVWMPQLLFNSSIIYEIGWRPRTELRSRLEQTYWRLLSKVANGATPTPFCKSEH